MSRHVFTAFIMDHRLINIVHNHHRLTYLTRLSHPITCNALFAHGGIEDPDDSNFHPRPSRSDRAGDARSRPRRFPSTRDRETMADESLPPLLRNAYDKHERRGTLRHLIAFCHILLHVRKCRGREQARQEQLRYLTPEQIRQLPSNCDLPKCKEYRILMDHMDNCKHGDHCKVKGCAFVNQYFAHFHQCIDDECKVCSLVRAEFGSAELTYGPTPFSKTWQETVPDFVRHEFAFKVFSIILCLDSPAYEPPPLPKDLHDSVLHDLVDAEETYFKTSGSKKEYGFFTASHYYKYRLMRNRAFSFALRERCHGMHKRTVALRHSMLRVWYLIDGHKDSHWFYVPVPDDLNVAPHYYKIISDPMDLTTLRRNIDNGKYECLRAFFNDVWLIFENARHYNTDESDVHIATFEMLKHLGPLANKMLTSMGYCCGEHRTYPPSIILCHSAKGCAIKPREYYWFYDEPCFHPVTGKPTMPRRYRFCDTCYTHAVKSGDRLIAGSDLAVPYGGTPTELDPKKFVMINNVRPRREPMVQCLSCNKLSHSVCVSHIKPMFPGGFLCPPCTRKITGMDYKITKMSNRLPHCNISKYIETRVNDFIKEELDKDPKADFEKSRIAIRMLCNSVHEVEVKPRIRSQYPSLPDKIPYRSKAIFAFQMVNGREICFFGMHVQEYGDVPGPNRHRVYISYLDSVHYFEPRNLRTRVYYMMILSYLENCTERGFRTAHIWACPPSTGDDYIFNGHPSEQKMPKTKQLQDWYQKMAAFGMERKLIVSYKHLSEYVVEHGIRTMAEMPYFEGDFWVNHMEEIIEECEKREIKQQQQLAKDLERLEKQSTPVADLFPMVNPLSPYRKNSKSRPAASSASTAKRRCLSHRQQTLQEIIEERFSAAVKKNRDNFFCFTLIPEDEPNKVQTVPFMDTDPLLPSEFMDGRDAFLAKCRENSWVFSTPRHTHYSTLQMCHTLMNQAPLVVHYTCNGCGKDPAWHCLTCDDFDVCNTCPQTHPHPLEMLATLNDLEEVAARRRERDHFMFLGKQALPHALACRNTSDCEFPLCSTAKKMQSHWMSCAIKLKDCISCRLYCGRVMLHHLSECQSDECVVPDCRRRRQGHPASRLLELERAHFEREVSYEAVKKKCMDCTRSYSGTRNLMPPPPIPLRQQPHRAVKRVMSDGDAHQSAVGRTVPQRVMSLPSNVVQEGRSRPQLMLDNTQAPSRQVPNASNVYMEQHSTPSTSNWSESPGPSSQTRGYYQSAGPTSPTLPPNVRIVKRTRPPDEFEHYPPQYSQNAYMPHAPRPQQYHLQPSPLTRSADMAPPIRAIPRGRMTMRTPAPQSAQFLLRPVLPDTARPRYYLRQQPVRQDRQDAPLPYPLNMNHAPYQVIQPPPAKRRRTNAAGAYTYEMLKTPSNNHLQYVILQPKPNTNGYRPHARRSPSPMQDPPVLEPYSADTDMIDSSDKSVKSVGTRTKSRRRSKKQV